MQLTAIVSVQRASHVEFVDEEHLAYAVPFGLVIEHVATGRQRRVWPDRRLHHVQGHCAFAIDKANGHIALHQDSPDRVVTIICSRSLDVLDSLTIQVEQQPRHVVTQQPLLCHMSFSSDGRRLVVGTQSHLSTLWIFSRPSPGAAFVQVCSHTVDITSTPHPPTFAPSGNESLCWIDEGNIHVIRTEPVLGRIDVKICQVDVAALPGSDRITAHMWHPNGDLLVGTSAGTLFTVRQAVVSLAASHEMDTVHSNMFQLQPLFEAELSKWTAGAIVSLHLVEDNVAVVFECPDGKGGLLLWVTLSSLTSDNSHDGSTAQASLKAVELPLGKVTFSTTSPNKSQMVVMDVAGSLLVLRTRANADVGSFTLASTSHSGHVIGVETVHGTPAAAGILFVTLDVVGTMRAFIMEPGARMEGGDITAKLTLLQSGSVGARGAAIASHPILPLVALATITGDLYLVGTAEFTGCTARDVGLEGPCGGCVQFCAHVMQGWGAKELRWSPDGALLACLDIAHQEIILLKRKPSPLRKDKHILAPLNRISVPQANLVCWHQSGTCMPILIIHQAKGNILLLDLPREVAGVHMAALDFQTVLRSCYRLTDPLADIQVLRPQSSENHVVIVGTCLDRSIRRCRLALERSRATSKKASSHVFPLASIEAEVLQVLHGQPTCAALTPSFSTMFVGSRSGTLHQIDMSTFEASSATVQVHSSDTNGVSAVAVLGEDCLVTADCAGVMHAMIMSSRPSMTSSQPSIKNAKPLEKNKPGGPRLQGGIFVVSRALVDGQAGLNMTPTQVLPLTEVLKEMLRKQCERKRDKWTDFISSSVQNCSKRLARLKRRNDAVTDDSERLTVDEFIICPQLASKLRNKGMEKAADMKHRMRNETVTETLRAQRVLARTRCQMAVQEEALSSIPMYNPVSLCGTKADKHQPADGEYVLVYSMAMPMTDAETKLVLAQQCFLRQVEQCEWHTRPVNKQGLFAAVPVLPVSDNDDLANTAETAQLQATEAANIREQPPGHEFAYAALHNGTCQLLYAPLQLHLCRRKLSQLHLLALEEQEIQRRFNVKFDALRTEKDRILSRIEEQLARVCSIQTELGVSVFPAEIVPGPEEEEARWIRVEPHELKAKQWQSPSQRRQLEEEAKRNAEHEAAAKGNKSQAAALLAMMNGSMETHNKLDLQQVQRRQSWMDMPIKAMSKAQRDALKEYERQVQEAEENLRNAQRMLEGERKALEEDVTTVIKAFNSNVALLQKQRLLAEVQVGVTQQLRLRHGSMLLQAAQLIKNAHQESGRIPWRTRRLSSLRHIVDELRTQVTEDHAEYMELAHRCKLLDRSFSKSFQGLGAQSQAALDVYRNTDKSPTYITYGGQSGSRAPPALEVVLDAVPSVDQGKPKRDKLGTSIKVEHSGDISGKPTWRPGCSPPAKPTWNKGSALSAEDRPEAISEADWKRIMQYRDCRLGQLEKLANTWETGSENATTLDAYVAETLCLGNKLQAAHEKMEKITHTVVKYLTNVPVTFSGHGGQVEVTEDQLLPDMQQAVLIHRDRINVLNGAIQQQGGKVLELLQDCSHLRSRQEEIAWALSMNDLAAEHKAEHVKELQLFHVTREVQDVLDSDHKSLSRPSELTTLEKLRDLNQRVQVTLTKQRSKQFIELTDAVAQRLEMNQELANATNEAYRILKNNQHIKQLSKRNEADRVARTAIYFKRIAMQNRLRTVALTQTQELIALCTEKEALVERNFPSFRCEG